MNEFTVWHGKPAEAGCFAHVNPFQRVLIFQTPNSFGGWLAGDDRPVSPVNEFTVWLLKQVVLPTPTRFNGF